MTASSAAEMKRFVRDWVFFALAPIWVALVLSALYRFDLFDSELSGGALAAYALALSWSFFDDAPTDAWTKSEHRVQKIVGYIIPSLKYILTISCLAVVSGVAVQGLSDKLSAAVRVSPSQSFQINGAAALSALLGAIAIILVKSHTVEEK